MFRWVVERISRLCRLSFIGLIKLYRLFISPILGQHCRFYPSCSQYTMDAIASRGVVMGIYLGCRRLCRCHPWHPGGYDPAPEKKA